MGFSMILNQQKPSYTIQLLCPIETPKPRFLSFGAKELSGFGGQGHLPRRFQSLRIRMAFGAENHGEKTIRMEETSNTISNIIGS